MSNSPGEAVLREYYAAYRANRERLEAIADGVEAMILRMREFAAKEGTPTPMKVAYNAAAEDMRRELQQLLCNHPENSAKYGNAEAWCVKCNKKLTPQDYKTAYNEVLEASTVWCKCDTEGCPVHRGGKRELPLPISAIPRPAITGAMISDFVIHLDQEGRRLREADPA